MFQKLFGIIVILFIASVAIAPIKTATAAPKPTILVMGDSLVAGFGLSKNEAFPAQLEVALTQKGHTVRVINAGISGETTHGGLARARNVAAQRADIVILELGANDALRGLPPEKAKANLNAIITTLKSSGSKILLAGMQAPLNMGTDYANRFNPIYESLADKHDIALYPFFLEGVALDPRYNLQDGMHPNPAGVAIIVENILPMVEEMVE